MQCNNCNKLITDIHTNYILCCICNHYFCIMCNHSHIHNHYNDNIECKFNCYYIVLNEIYDILKKKEKYFYKSISSYKSLFPLYDYMYDYRSYQTERYNIEQKFIYKFIKLVLQKRFCNDIIMCILNFL